MLDPRDFIDSDEGRNEPAPFFTYGEPCENCGSACDSGTRVWVPGYNYWACYQCAEEAEALIFAEKTCPSLYDAIMRASHVYQVRNAVQEHKQTCPNCNPKLKALPVRHEVGSVKRVEERAA